jgi:hypothetical protein
MRDHPMIERLMSTGEGGRGVYPRCPVCGSECETIFRDKGGFLVGCDECITKVDAWEDRDAMN